MSGVQPCALRFGLVGNGGNGGNGGAAGLFGDGGEIGRASGRERVCAQVVGWGGAGGVKGGG
ncbi:hypothetical protein PJN91_30485, partial [Mycobacterium kansasii]